MAAWRLACVLLASITGPSLSFAPGPVHRRRPATALSATRRQLAQAAGGVLLGTVAYGADRQSAPDTLALLHRMERESPPLSEALANGRPSLVEFYADWCTICRDSAPRMRAIEREFASEANFVVINGGEQAKLAARFRCDGIPHLAFVDAHGTILTSLIGNVPKDVVAEQLRALVRGDAALPYEGYDPFGADARRRLAPGEVL